MSPLNLPADLAEMLHTNERKALDWVRRYEWPHIRIGNAYYFTDEHLAEIKAKHTKRPAKAAPLLIEGQTKRSAAAKKSS